MYQTEQLIFSSIFLFGTLICFCFMIWGIVSAMVSYWNWLDRTVFAFVVVALSVFLNGWIFWITWK